MPDAFAHPAKMARGLVERIVLRFVSEGWVTPGQRIGDPFGGIGTTGILCSYNGLRSISVEIEPRFYDLANRNFEMHRVKWEATGDPTPQIMLGDSRHFAQMVGELSGVVTSPPYADSIGVTGGAQKRPNDYGHIGNRVSTYGQTAGQIGREKQGPYWGSMRLVYEQILLSMKPGAVAAIVGKDCIVKGARVRLCDGTCTLLKKLGFDVFERTRCHLVKTELHPSLFDDAPIEKKTERKSFFRRLHESKLSPDDERRIDWEEIIWARSALL